MFKRYKIHPIHNNLICFSDGKIFSISANKYLTSNPKKYGYIQINIKKKVTKLAHRLIAEAFFGVSDLYVNHKNGIRRDNRIDNLEYVTARQNTIHAIETGLMKARDISGDKNPTAKLNNDLVAKIKEIRSITGLSYLKIGKMFNVSEMTISNICRNKSWKA